jgi:hypothetical protein
MKSLGIKASDLSSMGHAEHTLTFWQLVCNPDVLLRDVAMRLFTFLASALGVERRSGARRTWKDTRRAMASTQLVQLLLVMMNGSLLNYAMLEQLGVCGSALQALEFDDMYEELLFMDEEDLVAALQGAPAHSDAHSDAPNNSEEAGSDGSNAVSVD